MPTRSGRAVRRLDPCASSGSATRGTEVLDIQQRLVVARLCASTSASSTAGSARHLARPCGRSRPAGTSASTGSWVPTRGGSSWRPASELGDRTLYLHAPHFRGDDVRALQRKLNALGFDAGREDGVHGPRTDRAVREFQRNVGEEAGRRRRAAHDRASSSACARSRTCPAGRWCARPKSSGRCAPGSRGRWSRSTPATAPSRGCPTCTWRWRARWPTELAALGAKPAAAALEGEDASPSDRARAANELDAALCVSLHLGVRRPEAQRPHVLVLRQRDARIPPPAGISRSSILDELERALGRRGRLQRLTVRDASARRGCRPCRSSRCSSRTARGGSLADPASRRRVGGRRRGRRPPVLRLRSDPSGRLSATAQARASDGATAPRPAGPRARRAQLARVRSGPAGLRTRPIGYGDARLPDDRGPTGRDLATTGCALADAAEHLGFEGLFRSDHYFSAPRRLRPRVDRRLDAARRGSPPGPSGSASGRSSRP